MPHVQAVCDVLVIENPEELALSPAGKPFLRLSFPNGIKVDITTNLAEMIGGCGAGLRLRLEDQRK